MRWLLSLPLLLLAACGDAPDPPPDPRAVESDLDADVAGDAASDAYAEEDSSGERMGTIAYDSPPPSAPSPALERPPAARSATDMLGLTAERAQRPGGLLGLGLPVALATVDYWIVSLRPQPGLQDVVADLLALRRALEVGDEQTVGHRLHRLAEAAAAAGDEHPDWASEEGVSLSDLANLLSETADDLEGR